MAQRWTPHYSTAAHVDRMNKSDEIGVPLTNLELGELAQHQDLLTAAAYLYEQVPDAEFFVDKDAAGRVRITLTYPSGQ